MLSEVTVNYYQYYNYYYYYYYDVSTYYNNHAYYHSTIQPSKSLLSPAGLPRVVHILPHVTALLSWTAES
jgi:hypothetical protein